QISAMLGRSTRRGNPPGRLPHRSGDPPLAPSTRQISAPEQPLATSTGGRRLRTRGLLRCHQRLEAIEAVRPACLVQHPPAAGSENAVAPVDRRSPAQVLDADDDEGLDILGVRGLPPEGIDQAGWTDLAELPGRMENVALEGSHRDPECASHPGVDGSL